MWNYGGKIVRRGDRDVHAAWLRGGLSKWAKDNLTKLICQRRLDLEIVVDTLQKEEARDWCGSMAGYGRQWCADTHSSNALKTYGMRGKSAVLILTLFLQESCERRRSVIGVFSLRVAGSSAQAPMAIGVCSNVPSS